MTLLKFKPQYQSYVWGGSRIGSLFNRTDVPSIAAESWEISDREGAMSVCTSFPHAGKTLRQLLEMQVPSNRFPLLVKIIDAKETLSVQVHPDEHIAPLLQGEAKSELWIALKASHVYAGFRKKVTKEMVLWSIEQGTLPNLLQSYYLQPKEALYIPAGTLHSIGGGSLLLEVQQNSNTTYRLFDWGRDRPLHLKEGAQALHIASKPTFSPFIANRPIDCSPYFKATWLEVGGRAQLASDANKTQILFCHEGEGVIKTAYGEESITAGETILIERATQVDLVGHCSLVLIE